MAFQCVSPKETTNLLLCKLLFIIICFNPIGQVIGDKKGGGTANALRNKNHWSVLYEIQEVLQIPIKFIHVIRNPFDNIATIMLRATESRDVVKEDGVMVGQKDTKVQAFNFLKYQHENVSAVMKGMFV